jgi:DNA-binding NarL/FixJ family response regulator
VFTARPDDDHEDMHASTGITVVLADKPGIARSTMALVVSGTPGLALLAEASSLPELAAVIRHTRPDVVVVDDRLLRHDALTAAAVGSRLVVVGIDDDPAYPARARRIGAEAWVPKDRADELLPDILLSAAPVTLAA